MPACLIVTAPVWQGDETKAVDGAVKRKSKSAEQGNLGDVVREKLAE